MALSLDAWPVRPANFLAFWLRPLTLWSLLDQCIPQIELDFNLAIVFDSVSADDASFDQTMNLDFCFQPLIHIMSSWSRFLRRLSVVTQSYRMDATIFILKTTTHSPQRATDSSATRPPLPCEYTGERGSQFATLIKHLHLTPYC